MNEQKRREQDMLDYLDALDEGDDNVLERLLKIAEKDAIFAEMIRDIHTELAQSTWQIPAQIAEIPHAKAHLIELETPQQDGQRGRGWLSLVAVLLMTILGGIVLLTVQSGTIETAMSPLATDDFIFIEGETDCTTASIPETECEGLLTLFRLTNGAQWRVNVGWNENNDPCQWQHVTCRDGHVVALNFNNNRLNGIISRIDYLPYLEVLDLGDNMLSGSLDDFRDLPDLRYLDLSENDYRAGFPDLATLPALEHLDLSHNVISGTLNGLAFLSQLAYLDISHTNIEGDLSGLEVATNLSYVDISQTGLSSTGIDWGQFRQLTTLITE